MLYIFHYFNNVVRPHGSMVDIADSAPGDGCSPRLRDNTKKLQNHQRHFVVIWMPFWENISQCRDLSTKATTFYAQMEFYYGNINQIYTHTCSYMQIHAYTCIQYTRRYWHIACMCIYLCVYVGLCRYCQYTLECKDIAYMYRYYLYG